MVKYNTTPQFLYDLIEWFEKYLCDKYKTPFLLLTVEEKESQIADFISLAIEKIKAGAERDIVDNDSYYYLNIRDHYRNPNSKYIEFKLKPEHFTCTVKNPFTGTSKTFTLNE
jgi:hypothetical protein